MRKIKLYFITNGLLLNPKKTQCILIGNRQLLSRIPPETFINCYGVHIHPSTHVKNLVIYFDKYMLFDVHIDELDKVMGVLMFLSRVSEHFDKTTRIIVVQSLVFSLINYCISIWGSTCNMLLHSVQKLQNFAAKVAIGGARKYDHATPFIKELKCLTINDKYIFEKCTTVYKAIHGLYPDWYIKFPTVSARAASITMQENNLHIPRAKTDSGARATTICGPNFWNNLPHHTKNSGSLHSFNSGLSNVFLKDS